MNGTPLLELLRFASGEHSTLGVLYLLGGGYRTFLCFTLEDEFRPKKVQGETCIPPGRYTVVLRTEGGHHERYERRFADIHRGMLWLKDVPNFQWILIHCGNLDTDTEGCPLVGDISEENATKRGRIANSETAYRRVYPKIAALIKKYGSLAIVVTMYDTPLLLRKAATTSEPPH